MPVVIVASTLPVAVLCSGTTHPEGVEPYKIEIAGERDPGAVNGTGITYDVDQVAFDEWMTANPALLESVRTITPEEIDDLATAADEYGFEAGLDDIENGGTLAADKLTLSEARTIAQVAAQRAREADRQLREADNARKMADLQTEAAQAERQAAEDQQKQALAIVDGKTEEQNRRTPPRQEQPGPGPGEPGYVPPQPA